MFNAYSIRSWRNQIVLHPNQNRRFESEITVAHDMLTKLLQAHIDICIINGRHNRWGCVQVEVADSDDVEAMQLMVHRKHDFLVWINGRWDATVVGREKRRPVAVRCDVVLTVREGMGYLRAFPDIFLVSTRIGLAIFEMVSKGTQSMWQADHVEYTCCDQEYEGRRDGQL